MQRYNFIFNCANYFQKKYEINIKFNIQSYIFFFKKVGSITPLPFVYATIILDARCQSR
jgi:hypothetical protein